MEVLTSEHFWLGIFSGIIIMQIVSVVKKNFILGVD